MHAPALSSDAIAARRRFRALLATQICFGMSFSMFFLMPKYLSQELHESELTIGAIGAVGALAGVLSFPVAGALSDRHGRWRFIVLGNLALTGAALSMLLLSRAFPWMYVVRVVQGFAFAFAFNSTTTLATDDVDTHALGRVLAYFGAALLGTQALAPALAEAIAEAHGWSAVFTAAALFGLASTLIAASFVRERRRTGQLGPASLANLPALLASKPAVLSAVAAAGAGFGTVFTFYQPYALELGIERVAGFFVAYASCAVAVRFVAIERIERLGRRRVGAVSLLVYALAVLVTAWLRPGLLEPLGMAVGMAHGIFYPICNALAIEGVPSAERGSMMALYHGGFNAGFALAVLLGGLFVAHFGYPALFVSMGALVALSALPLLRERAL